MSQQPPSYSPQRVCLKCGNLLAPDAVFCDKCGSPAQRQVSYNQPIPQYGGSASKTWSKNQKIAGAVVAFGLIGLCIISTIASLFVPTVPKENKSILDKDYKTPTAPLSLPTPTPITSAERLKKAKEALAGYRPKGDSPYYGRLDEARKELYEIHSGDKEYKEAQLLLSEVARREEEERQRKASELRQQYAKTMEENFLKQGMDVTVTLSGPNNTTIKMKYVLMSRPMVYNLTNDQGVMNTLKTLGFKKVIFTDGYFHTWNIDVE